MSSCSQFLGGPASGVSLDFLGDCFTKKAAFLFEPSREKDTPFYQHFNFGWALRFAACAFIPNNFQLHKEYE